MLKRNFNGRTFRKSSASGAGNDCVYLPDSGILNAVADSKSGQTLAVSINPRLLASLTR